MSQKADVCLLLEGTYPFVMGGVSGWTHALVGAAPHLTFHIVVIMADDAPRERKYEMPSNVVGLTCIPLDGGSNPHTGRNDDKLAMEFGRRMHRALTDASVADFWAAAQMVESNHCGHGLLNSRSAWRAMENAYTAMLPTAPMVNFFWTWRTLLRSVLSLISAPLPEADVYHAISTGYAGLYGARAHLRTARPFVITEHGIYTSERRIEIGLAEWLYDSGRGGFGVDPRYPELRDLWQSAFSAFAKIAYDCAEQVTTLYTGNQAFQRADGAQDSKLRVIPNGVDYARYSKIVPEAGERPPTVGLIGRVVPIKDTRTFIFACAALRRRIPNLRAMVLGPEDEDEVYANECRQLVEQNGLTDCLTFEGRANVAAYLAKLDVVALTSVSEAQPLVLLEAGAAGVPSVATDVGSCRDILEGFVDDTVPGTGGIVVAVGDSEAIADALEKILSDASLRHSMGAVMKERVEKTYNKTIVDKIYNGLYEGLLQRVRSSGPLRQGGPWPA